MLWFEVFKHLNILGIISTRLEDFMNDLPTPHGIGVYLY